MSENQPLSADYWNDLYAAGDTGWDKGRVAPPIERLIATGRIPKGKVAVLGAGFGHEALHLANAGFTVTAVDFAPLAVKELRARAAAQRVPMEVLERDLFDLPRTHAGAF